MISVVLNGKETTLDDGATLVDAVIALGLAADAPGIAAAANFEVVPRGSWAQTPLADGMQIEVVTATQGG